MADKKITMKQYTGSGTNYDTLYPATTADQVGGTFDASKIGSGTFDVARIPTLDINDNTTDTLSVARRGTGNTSVDTTPTMGSTKMCTSGGIYTEIQNVKSSTKMGFTQKISYDSIWEGKSFAIKKGGATVSEGVFSTSETGERIVSVFLEEVNTLYTIESLGVSVNLPTTPEYYKNLPLTTFNPSVAFIHATYPAGASITCSKDSISLTGDTSGDYTFMVQSLGTWDLSITSGTQFGSNSANITNYGQTINVSVTWFNKSFNNATWSEVKKIATMGVGASFWKVGDRKAVTLNGTVGNKTFSNTTTYCYILGFNHNVSVESNGEYTIHIGFGASALSGGAYIAYVDSKYSSTVSTTGYFSMNSSNTNTGGWNSCQMKSTICSAFKNALPSDLQSNIRAVTKWQNDGNSTTGQSSSNEIWLLSEMEIFGKQTYSGYTANQLQYDFYKGVTGWSAASKVKYQDTSTSTAAHWWERSAYSSNSSYFCYVYTNGSADYYVANYSIGFAPCLCL